MHMQVHQMGLPHLVAWCAVNGVSCHRTGDVRAQVLQAIAENAALLPNIVGFKAGVAYREDCKVPGRTNPHVYGALGFCLSHRPPTHRPYMGGGHQS